MKEAFSPRLVALQARPDAKQAAWVASKSEDYSPTTKYKSEAHSAGIHGEPQQPWGSWPVLNILCHYDQRSRGGRRQMRRLSEQLRRRKSLGKHAAQTVVCVPNLGSSSIIIGLGASTSIKFIFSSKSRNHLHPRQTKLLVTPPN